MVIHRLVLVLFVAACMSLGSPLLFAADYKIGAVNTGRLLGSALEMKGANARLEQEFGPQEKKIRADQKKMQEEEKKFNKNKDTMSASEQQRSEQNLLSMQRALIRAQDQLREDANIRRKIELSEIEKVVIAAIREVAREGKYTMILGDNGVLYADKSVDITDIVLEKLRKK